MKDPIFPPVNYLLPQMNVFLMLNVLPIFLAAQLLYTPLIPAFSYKTLF